MSDLLLDDYPLVLIPRLATLVGLNEAIVLQQLNYWLKRSSHQHEGRTWIYNTYEEWQEQFPFWSTRTIRRALDSLREQGLVLQDRFNEKAYDKTNWYTIDYERLDKMDSGLAESDWTKWTDRSGQNDPTNTRDYTETTTTDSVKEESVEPAYVCPDCGLKCASKGGLTNHRRAKHGTDTRHPAVRAYQEVTKCRPIESVRQLIIDCVGDDTRRVNFWHDVVMAYCALGWNKANVANMLDFYRKGEIPQTKRGPPSEVQGEKDRLAYIRGQYAAYIEH